jgi:small subunit ribosomal protein S1
MVKKQNSHHTHHSPPIDEGWWEAVLAAEDEFPQIVNERSANSAELVNELKLPGSEGIDAVNWSKAVQIYENDLAVTLDVTGYNRGGLLVSGNGLHGFVPISHLIDIPCSSPDSDEWLKNYVDRSLFLKVIECNPERSRIVFSERAALSEPGSRLHLLNRLKPGDCVRGTVTNITEFGVFVDLGGIEGLIHVSELSWGRVQHPVNVVELGQVVEVHVIQVDRERVRVALSLKRLHPNPWETAAERYFPGQVTQAVVTSVVPFGAFARLEEGLDGLIHVSEINVGSEDKKKIPLLEGQQITVRVLHVDCQRQRLGLSLCVEK